ncbi:MAG: hypothetical protein JRS35_22125, partial [Deltaproteobacteria bacterium]|nr:hypothetical protein [Deltaproteobacteria bacterium]
MYSPGSLATPPALLRALSILCLLALGAPAPAGADTFTVSNTDDSGSGSLRQAIIDANGTNGADQIVFDATLVGQTITLDSALPVIAESVTIDGEAAAGLTIDGDGSGRVFFVDTGTVEIANLDVVGGAAEGGAGAGRGGGGLGAGGGLFVASGAQVTLRNVVFDDHTAEGGDGGDGSSDGGGGGGLGGAGGLAAGGGGGFGADDDGEDGTALAGGKGGGTLG